MESSSTASFTLYQRSVGGGAAPATSTSSMNRLTAAASVASNRQGAARADADAAHHQKAGQNNTGALVVTPPGAISRLSFAAMVEHTRRTETTTSGVNHMGSGSSPSPSATLSPTERVVNPHHAGGSSGALAAVGKAPRKPRPTLEPLMDVSSGGASHAVVAASGASLLSRSVSAPPALIGGSGGVEASTTSSAYPATNRVAVASWIQRSSSALEGTSPSIAAELLFRHVMQQTERVKAESDLPSHPVRLAVACLLLQQRFASHPSPLLEMLVGELIAACYEPDRRAGAPRAAFLAEALNRLGIEPMSGVEAFLSRMPTFEALRLERAATAHLQQQLSRFRESTLTRKRVVGSCARKWSSDLVAVVFRAWRAYIITSARLSRGITDLVHRVTRRDTLLTHFYAWRGVTVESTALRSRKALLDTVEGVAEREAVTNVSVVELTDKLDEARLLTARLRQEKSQFEQRENTLKQLAETSDQRCRVWRDCALTSVAMHHDTCQRQTLPTPPTGASNLLEMAETASTVLLGWVRQRIQHLPGYPGSKKVDNFGTHLKDGTVYVLLAHALTKGAVELAVLQNTEPARRVAVALEALRDAVDFRTPFKPDDLVAGATDINCVFLYCLWCRSYSPVPDKGPIHALKPAAPFRDEAAAAKSDLELLQRAIPEWIDHRNVLFEYTTYIMQCRAKGTAVKVVVSEEEKRLAKDLERFTVKGCNVLPEVFVDFQFMSAQQRAANEEERSRINDVIAKHVSLLRDAFITYAADASGGGGGAGKRSKGKRGHGDDAPLGSDLDYVGFYRLCSDCGLVNDGRRQVPSAAAGGVGEAGAKQAEDQAAVATAAAAASGGQPLITSFEASPFGKPNLLTKGECHKLFLSINNRYEHSGESLAAHTGSTSPKNRAAARNLAQANFEPAELMLALVVMAARRYGPKVPVKPSASPIPTSERLDYFLSHDLAVGVGRNPADDDQGGAGGSSAAAFASEVSTTPSIQAFLHKRRKTLVPYFEHFAGLDGDGTMQLDELFEALRAIEFFTLFPALTTTVVEATFKHITNSSEPKAAPPPPPAAATNFLSRSNDTGGDDDDDDESVVEPSLIYSDFETLLAALAATAQPSPFVPLAAKVQSLVDAIMPKVTAVVKKLEKLQQQATLAASVAD